MHCSYKYLFWVSIILFCLSYLFAGCIVNERFSRKRTKPAQHHHTNRLQNNGIKNKKNRKQTYYIHTVKYEGESLSLISKWYLGNFKDWKLLSRYNPELDPDNIHVGDRVRIPKKRMKTFKPMPETLLNGNNKIKKKKTEKKAMELYGPKEHKENNNSQDYNNDL